MFQKNRRPAVSWLRPRLLSHRGREQMLEGRMARLLFILFPLQPPKVKSRKL